MALAYRRSRRSRRNRRYYGGQAPVNYSNPGPMTQNLAQGLQFARFHEGQHGGMGPYPGSVTQSMLPGDLAASARINPTLAAYAQIRGLQDGGKGRKGSRKNNRKNTRKGSRKNNRKNTRKNNRKNNRKNTRKNNRKNTRRNRRQYGGDFVRWGGGGYNLAVDAPMTVQESSKMLIPDNLLRQAGLHPEWADAARPNSMTPK